ncbi:MAG: hypothetical protein GY701_08080 [Sulfitobacter sp.]|nr:hypothetical protein [Sulfitobacter sp.]
MTPEQKRRKLILMQQQAGAKQAASPAPAQRNPDGTYGQPPAGHIPNPATGQMTNQDMLRNNAETSSRGSFGRGVGGGITFGFDDEARALGAYLRGGDEWGNFRLEQARAQQEVDREKHPVATMGGQIAGGAAPAIGSAPLAVGKGIGGAMLRGAGIGAVEGALHGAGAGEGAGGRAASAGGGAGVGFFVGGAAPAITAGVRSAARSVADPMSGIFDAMMERGSPHKANRAVMDALLQSKQSVDDVSNAVSRATQDGQPDFRLMDALGVAGQRRASGVVRAGGDAGTELAEYLESRQLGQPERLAGFIDEGFGMGGDSARARASALTSARNTAADTAYDAARGNAAPVDVRSALSVIDDRIGSAKGSGVAGDAIDGRLAGYRARLAVDPASAPEGATVGELSFDQVLGVKQAVQDDIGAAVRAGRNNEARELGKLVSSLDNALQQASPSYRAANDEFARASGVIDAVDQGARMARPGERAADTTAQFARMTPDQQGAARVGYGDRLLQRIEAGTAPTANRAKALQSPKVEAERGAMALDPDLLARRIGRENDMWATQNRALGGSRTADNLADIESTSGIAGGAADVAKALLNLNVGDAAARAGQTLAPLARGETDATRAMIVKALMSQDPKAALAPAVRQKMSGDLRDSIIAALLREPARRSIPGQ